MKRPSHFSKEIRSAPLSAIPGTLLLFLMMLPLAKSQNVITNGTTLKISAGTTLISAENLLIKPGSMIDNAGMLILRKDLTNENAGMNSLGSGSAELSGTVNQTINGQSVFTGFTVSNAAGVTIGGNTTVNGTFTLSNGKVTLGASNLILGPLAVMTGTPMASAMIVATASGEFRKEFPVGFSGSFTYPVGDNTGSSDYSPVTLSFTAGTITAGNYIGVSLQNEMYPDPDITGNYLNRYWKLTQSGFNDLVCNASFRYLPADVVGTESKLSCTKVNGLPWVTYSTTDETAHLLSANGIITLGSFTGLKSTTAPLNQELANIAISNGLSTCYDAVQVLTVAGGETTFLVENNGSVTLVAGNRISMLNGTKVSSGGYLLGRITTNGNFCEIQQNPLVANTPKEQSLSSESLANKKLIKVYPNPTTDVVTVEIGEGHSTLAANVTVYSLHGEKLIQKEMNGVSRYQFSLLDKPAGFYLIRVQSGKRCEIVKVVKY